MRVMMGIRRERGVGKGDVLEGGVCNGGVCG